MSALVRTERAFAGTISVESSASFPGHVKLSKETQPFKDERPQALLVAFYNQQCQQGSTDECGLPSNVASCLPPDQTIDVDSAVMHAKEAFGQLYPEAVSAFETAAANNGDAESDDEALEVLGDVLQLLNPT